MLRYFFLTRTSSAVSNSCWLSFWVTEASHGIFPNDGFFPVYSLIFPFYKTLSHECCVYILCSRNIPAHHKQKGLSLMCHYLEKLHIPPFHSHPCFQGQVTVERLPHWSYKIHQISAISQVNHTLINIKHKKIKIWHM